MKRLPPTPLNRPKPAIRKPPAPTSRKPAPATKRRPPLEFLTEVAKNPLADMQAPVDDVGAQATEIVDRVRQAYRAREKEQRERYDFADSTAYFRVLVFDTPEQARAFAVAMGHEPTKQYMDGRKVCDVIGVEIPEAKWTVKKAKPHLRLADLALPLKQQE